jgi:hypothetical protein
LCPSVAEHLPKLIKAATEEPYRIRDAWMRFETTQVYIRVGPRVFIHPEKKMLNCIQIANFLGMREQDQRKGTFTRLIALIRTITDLPFFLENVRHDLAAALVERYGWSVNRRESFGSFFGGGDGPIQIDLVKYE